MVQILTGRFNNPTAEKLFDIVAPSQKYRPQPLWLLAIVFFLFS
jgi:hypothetical protein